MLIINYLPERLEGIYIKYILEIIYLIEAIKDPLGL